MTAERDGVTTSRTGRYGYAALGVDAGRVTQSYDDALRCEGKVYAYTASGERDAAADFDLDGGNRFPAGIAFADGRFHVADSIDDKVYAYTASGERAADGDSRGVHAGLAVASPTASDSAPSPGGSFTLSATVRNDGGAEAPGAAMLTCFRDCRSR